MILYCKKLALNDPYVPYVHKLNFEKKKKKQGGMMDAPGAAIWSRAAMLGVSSSLWKQPLLTLTSKVTTKNRIRFCQGC